MTNETTLPTITTPTRTTLVVLVRAAKNLGVSLEGVEGKQPVIRTLIAAFAAMPEDHSDKSLFFEIFDRLGLVTAITEGPLGLAD